MIFHKSAKHFILKIPCMYGGGLGFLSEEDLAG